MQLSIGSYCTVRCNDHLMVVFSKMSTGWPRKDESRITNSSVCNSRDIASVVDLRFAIGQLLAFTGDNRAINLQIVTPDSIHGDKPQHNHPGKSAPPPLASTTVPHSWFSSLPVSKMWGVLVSRSSGADVSGGWLSREPLSLSKFRNLDNFATVRWPLTTASRTSVNFSCSSQPSISQSCNGRL